MRVIAVIDQPAVFRQILEHLGIARPHVDRSPPIHESRRAMPARALVCEHPAWAYDPREADPPLMDPLTV